MSKRKNEGVASADSYDIDLAEGGGMNGVGKMNDVCARCAVMVYQTDTETYMGIIIQQRPSVDELQELQRVKIWLQDDQAVVCH